VRRQSEVESRKRKALVGVSIRETKALARVEYIKQTYLTETKARDTKITKVVRRRVYR
jgi:hypothetical protein